ncbi:MAG: hypothetical protein M3347_02425, partial [Armatimonadota bacterium]|nr:hypothetical protein [Armatimonadota bacterium]
MSTNGGGATPPSVTFVNGPGTPPLGRGSVELRVGSDGNSTAQIRHPGYAGTVLPDPTAATPAANELTALSYNTYVQSGGSGGQSPMLVLLIDNDNNNTVDDQLFFEPVYQNGTHTKVDPNITIPNQCGANSGCVTPGQWQTWDALNGGWWSLNAATFGPPLTTLKFYRSQHPNARIMNTSPGLGGVRFLTGLGAGAWDNFIGNVDNVTIGVGGNDTVYDFDLASSPPSSTGPLLISELRTSGPGGAGDDYVEIYNNSDAPHTVAAPDGSAGYGVFAMNNGCSSDPVLVGFIPFGTVIPARGHYLFVGSAYSLSGYAAGDQTLTADLANDANVGLFSTANPANVNARTGLDAVGFGSNTGNFCNVLREGSTLPGAAGSNAEHAFVRKYVKGAIADSGNNASDFRLVSTTTTNINGATPVLGAPGPQNVASPLEAAPCGTITIGRARFDPSVSAGSALNRERSAVVVPNGQFGTIRFRRTFTNAAAEPISRLRFRIYDLTALPQSNTAKADLRALSSSDEAAVATSTGPKPTSGATLENSAVQPNGGAINSSLAANQVTVGSPILPGRSTDVNFLFGVQQLGSYRLAILIETLPDAQRQEVWILTGHTDDAGDVESTCNLAPIIATNTGLTVNAGATATIDNTKLKVTSIASDTITFTLTKAPAKGTLKLNNGALAKDETFTQADIDDNKLSYTAGTTSAGADSFDFRASDGQGDSVTGTFNITIIEAPSLVVTTTSDSSTNTDGLTSLREAINTANNETTHPGADTITFDTTVFAAPHKTITLGGTQLPAITESVTITGPLAGVTISGNNASRVFQIDSGTVSLDKLTITNGNAGGDRGGGIRNSGTLMLSNCTLSGNSAGIDGGGIMNFAGLTLSNSTLSGNSASFGGGVYNASGATATIGNSTLSGNTATGAGGGIYNDATLTIGNSILKKGATGENLAGSVTTDEGYNLSSDGTGPNNGTTDIRNTDPQLGPLANNGGPTPTHALLAGSPAIDKGKALGGVTTDQRGRQRPVDLDDAAYPDVDDASDIGAFEAGLFDLPGMLQFSSATYSVNEGDGTATITVKRVDGKKGPVVVRYTTGNGSATASTLLQPGDYSTATALLRWEHGDTADKTFSVPIVNDSNDENDETVNLALLNPSGGALLGTPNKAVLTIVDNDSAKPDLLIRQESELDVAYAIDNEYQSTPSGEQIEAQLTEPGVAASYRVRVQN